MATQSDKYFINSFTCSFGGHRSVQDGFKMWSKIIVSELHDKQWKEKWVFWVENFSLSHL